MPVDIYQWNLDLYCCAAVFSETEKTKLQNLWTHTLAKAVQCSHIIVRKHSTIQLRWQGCDTIVVLPFKLCYKCCIVLQNVLPFTYFRDNMGSSVLPNWELRTRMWNFFNPETRKMFQIFTLRCQFWQTIQMYKNRGFPFCLQFFNVYRQLKLRFSKFS